MSLSCLEKGIRNLGKYVLFEEIGESYLGRVYKGVDKSQDRPAALRVISGEAKWSDQEKTRFTRAFRSVADLKHPNIAAIFDVEDSGEEFYIAAEFLGCDLRYLTRHKPALSIEEKLSIMIQVADGLGHAHKNGILHQDLHPSKIHLAGDGRVRIRDFAIAPMLQPYLSHLGMHLGAHVYLSPEQIQHKECDRRSEIFTAGIIFYELLTSVHPFHDPDANQVLDNILSDADLRASDHYPEAPPEIWQILRTCLAKEPTGRYSCMEELAGALRGLLSGVAEDVQLMLGELVAALPFLRRAAARLDASEGCVHLLQDIRVLIEGQKASYENLDRLMRTLIDVYPSIRAGRGDSHAEQLAQVFLLEQAKQASLESAESASPWNRSGMTPADDFPALKNSAMPRPQNNPEQPVMMERTAFGALPAELGTGLQEDEEPGATTSGVLRSTQGMPTQQGIPEDAVPKPRTKSRAAGRTGPVYQIIAALLAVLLIALSVYVIRKTSYATAIKSAWSKLSPASSPTTPSLPEASPASSVTQPPQNAGTPDPFSTLLEEAQGLAKENRLEEGKTIIRKILELNPSYEPAIAALHDIEAATAAAGNSEADAELKKEIERISALIASGKLKAAKVGLEKLQASHPDAEGVLTLNKRYESRNSRMASEQAMKDATQAEEAHKQKEEEWVRRVSDLMAQGKYGEAGTALNLWLAGFPKSSKVPEYRAKIEDAQRALKTYESAMAEKRYQDALGALATAERINPADSTLAELRRRVEARKAAARATLTVRRLGDRATTLLLDGKAIGANGETENENLAIGMHTLAIESQGRIRATATQEFLDGQRVSYVYDLDKPLLRPFTEADRELIARRKDIESPHRFAAVHSHGVFRGSCKGELVVDLQEVEYKPVSGSHFFKVPFKSLKLSGEGKTLIFTYTLDGREFQSLRVQDESEVEELREIWNKLRASGP